MTTVFIAGSMSIKRIDPLVRERLSTVVEKGFDVVVGDADGVDASIQELLAASDQARVTVYCSGGSPRNNVGDWPVRTVDSSHAPGSRAYFTAKDLRMADEADYGLMIWDAKSPGTLGNVVELLARGRKSVVFVNRERRFLTVASADDLTQLLSLMSDEARRKVEGKLRLSDRLTELGHVQNALFD